MQKKEGAESGEKGVRGNFVEKEAENAVSC